MKNFNDFYKESIDDDDWWGNDDWEEAPYDMQQESDNIFNMLLKYKEIFGEDEFKKLLKDINSESL